MVTALFRPRTLHGPVRMGNGKRCGPLRLAALVSLAWSAQACAAPPEKGHPEMRRLNGETISIEAGGQSFLVDLYDNPTADDLLKRLPLDVRASNYPGYDEKVLRIPEPLSMEGAPRGDDPEIPEVGYYQPGQWIAIYYGPIAYWPGKVPLGRIHASVDEIAALPENTSVRIERKAR